MSDFRGAVPLAHALYWVVLPERLQRKLGGYISRGDGPTQFRFSGLRRARADGAAELTVQNLEPGYLADGPQPDGWLTLGGDPAMVSRDAEIVASRANSGAIGGAATPLLVMATDSRGLENGVVRLWVAPAAPPHRAVEWQVPLPAPLGPTWATASAAALAAALAVRLAHGLPPQPLDPGSLLTLVLAAGVTLPAALQLQQLRWRRWPAEVAPTAPGEAAALVATDGAPAVPAPRPARRSPAAAPAPTVETEGGGPAGLPVGAPRVIATAGARRWSLEGRPWSDSDSPRPVRKPLLHLVWTERSIRQILAHVDEATSERNRAGERETAGVLLGKLGWSERGERTGLVQVAMPHPDSTSGPFHVAIPSASLEQYRDAGWDVLALYHTHLPEAGIGATPSLEDQQTFQIIADESQALVIVDTERRDLGLYTWGVDGEGMCILQATELAALDWPEAEPPPFSNYRMAVRAESEQGPPRRSYREMEQALRDMAALGLRATTLLGDPGRRREEDLGG